MTTSSIGTMNGGLLSDGVLPIKYSQGRLLLVDQRLLPERFEYFDATEFEAICFAIKEMVVRGAPSIGVAAAFGLAMQAARSQSLDIASFLNEINSYRSILARTRPTAVNLRWALDKIFDEIVRQSKSDLQVEQLGRIAIKNSEQMLVEHIAINKTLSDFGASLIRAGDSIVTHCNAGSLATCGWGTALGVIRSAAIKGLAPTVFVDETRPRHQGSKLTVWELSQDGIPATLICDSMSGHIMSKGKAQLVITGADRIAGNGDTANKIGTYNLAVVANYHKVPFYIAAPLSTIDAEIESGDQIPIEERSMSEVTHMNGFATAMEGVAVYNPAFDVTPAALIAGIITEAGILRAPYEVSIAQALKSNHVFV